MWFGATESGDGTKIIDYSTKYCYDNILYGKCGDNIFEYVLVKINIINTPTTYALIYVEGFCVFICVVSKCISSGCLIMSVY